MTNIREALAGREQFEAWANRYPLSLEGWNGRTYQYSITQCAWNAWQARAALSAAPPEQHEQHEHKPGDIMCKQCDYEQSNASIDSGSASTDKAARTETPREPTNEMLRAVREEDRDIAADHWRFMWDVAAEESQPVETLAWLIERGQQEAQTPTIWWCMPGTGDATYGFVWTEDACKAHRFESKFKAEHPWEAGLTWRDNVPVDVFGELRWAHAVEHAFIADAAHRAAVTEEAGSRIPNADTMIGVHPDGSRLLNDAPATAAAPKEILAPLWSGDGPGATCAPAAAPVQDADGMIARLRSLYRMLYPKRHLDTVVVVQTVIGHLLAGLEEAADALQAAQAEIADLHGHIKRLAYISDGGAQARLRVTDLEAALARAEVAHDQAVDTINRLRDGEPFQSIVAAHTIANATQPLLERAERAEASVRAADALRAEVMPGKYVQPPHPITVAAYDAARAQVTLPEDGRETRGSEPGKCS